MVHQATVQPALPFMGRVLSGPPGCKVCTEEIYHNLGYDLSEVKIWVTLPAKSPNPTDVLANEEGVLQRVEEKGGTDELLRTNCSSKQ